MTVQEGTYLALISSQMGARTSVDLVVRDGRIHGENSDFKFSGSYQFDGSKVFALIEVRRYNFNGPGGGVFGADNVDATFQGTIEDNGVIRLKGRGDDSFPQVSATLTWVSQNVTPAIPV